MKISAVICEYNPFHKGHAHLLAMLRQQPDSAIVCIMSGNFVQRGEPALFPKEHRAYTALCHGADLILELPLPYATAAAPQFALGAVSLIQAMGCVTHLGFGCETPDLPLLQQVAKLVDSPELQPLIRENMALGITYGAARERAVARLCPEVAPLLQNPNNILAVEYLRQLTHSTIQPVAIERKGTAHHGTQIEQGFASASYLRSIWSSHPEIAREAVPESAFSYDQQLEEQGEIFSRWGEYQTSVLSVLRRTSLEQLISLGGFSEGLENRFLHAISCATSLEELYTLTKTKRYTHARIRRLALASYLGIPDSLSHAPPPYLRVLGMNAVGKEVLSQMKRNASLPISHSLLRLSRVSPQCGQYAQLEAAATDQYTLFLQKPRPMHSDLRLSPILV